MPIPSFYRILLPLLRELNKHEECEFLFIKNKLAEQFKLSVNERSKSSVNHKNVFDNRVSWAKTYLIKAGLIIQIDPKKFKITDLGIKAVQSKVKEINYVFLKQFKQFRIFKKLKDQDNLVDDY